MLSLLTWTYRLATKCFGVFDDGGSIANVSIPT